MMQVQEPKQKVNWWVATKAAFKRSPSRMVFGPTMIGLGAIILFAELQKADDYFSILVGLGVVTTGIGLLLEAFRGPRKPGGPGGGASSAPVTRLSRS